MKHIVRLCALCAALLALAACNNLEPPSMPADTTALAQDEWPALATTACGEGETGNMSQTGATGPKTTVQPGTTEPKATAPPQVVTVVIPEGFTFYQVARRLEANGVCTAKDFYNAAQGYQVQSFSVPFSPESCYRYEGCLFPDTYEFYQGDDPEAVLRKLLNNYAAKSGLPDYDTLILASIIERETRSGEHMAMVSSVFHNRLARGMRLQADATILYVENHIKKDLLVKNPRQYAERYNTYKCAALPAGPICSPSRRAIEAAKNPSQSDYLYYFFGNDNTNHYSLTHEEHEAAMAKYGVQSS